MELLKARTDISLTGGQVCLVLFTHRIYNNYGGGAFMRLFSIC